MTVDLNADKMPNRYGIDVFTFYITKNNIMPYGYKGDSNANPSVVCNNDKHVILNGVGCTGWVIGMGNMDYLRKTISW